jgi:phage/plasmid-associated DNA primase
VDEAAKVYRQNEDRIGIFLDEETKAAEGVTLRLKDLFMTYKFWSEDRGERPMTQIAFHRKLGDRGLKIIGAGSKAEIKDMTKALSAVSSSSEVTWSNLV